MLPNSTNISNDFIWPNTFIYTSCFNTINSLTYTQGEEETEEDHMAFHQKGVLFHSGKLLFLADGWLYVH